MNWRRTLTAADEPQEARFFLFMSAFGIVVGIIYWFVSHETAGTILLLGFGVATGLFGSRLATTPAARVVRQRTRTADGDEVQQEERTGSGTGGVDRPFLDEDGRLPDDTAAPFAVGLGLAIAATGLIFGFAPVLVGALPVAWGAWAWLSGARAELDAQDLSDTVVAPVAPVADPIDRDGPPPASARDRRPAAPRRRRA